MSNKRKRVEKVQLSNPDFRIDFTQLPPQDPLLMTGKIADEDIPARLKDFAAQHYHSFRTNYKRVSPSLGGNFNIRMPLGEEPINMDAIHTAAAAVIRSIYPFGVRFNVSFSIFLENEDEEDLDRRFLFYYASSNNHQLFERSQFISSLKDVEDVLDKINYEAISDHLNLIRESTKVRILHIASVLINALVLSDATQFS